MKLPSDAEEAKISDASEPKENGNGNGKSDDAPRSRTRVLAVAALGVVYGDIGTSPIYSMREAFFGDHKVPYDTTNVYGILSLILWSLIILISGKYLSFVMRGDNKGEGGIPALLALLNPWKAKGGSTRNILLLLGLFGAAMLYAGCTITPALSVLSAVEGLQVATPAFEPYVIPITIAILIGLFMIQSRGTAGIGKLFGPVIVLWFLVIAGMGISGIVQAPQILLAVNPWYAIAFFIHNGFAGFLVLSAVFLAMTGGEAMYADMGHFGLRPIRLAWFCVVLPAVVLNYFGQGALLLSAPGHVHQPFFDLAPSWFIYPLVVITTVATVIASQAVISGVFSMTRQFVQLRQLPRTQVIQTSHEEYGQIYIASVNWMLMLACLGLVIGFKTSGALAAAYGISVAGTMLITTVLAFFVAKRFGWNLWLLCSMCSLFFICDAAFFSANLFQVVNGGWYPVVLAIIIFTVMTTWSRGRLLLHRHLGKETESLEDFVSRIKADPPHLISGTGVFTTAGDAAPPRLLRHLDRHKVLNEQLILLTVTTIDAPRVPAADRLEVFGIAPGIYRITVSYGFMQDPNVPVALKLCNKLGLSVDLDHVTYYVGRETLIPSKDVPGGMWLWRERLFAFLSRNAMPATAFYGLPADDVVELGFHVEI